MLTLISLFFVVSPILILLTQGYKFSGTKKFFVPTGNVSIDPVTRNTTVYINDQHIEKNIDNVRLDPGQYTLRIEKDGFYTWQKDITVHRNQTTYIRDISLFEKNLPIREQKIEDENARLHPYAPYLFTRQDGYLLFSDLRADVKQPLTEITPGIETIFSDRNNSYAISDPVSSTLFVSNDGANGFQYRGINANSSTPLQWNTNPELLYIQTATGTIHALYDEQISTIGTYEPTLWYRENNGALWIYKNDVQRISRLKDTQTDSVRLEKNIPQLTKILFVFRDTLVALSETDLLFITIEKNEQLDITTAKTETIRLSYPIGYAYSQEEDIWYIWSSWELYSIAGSSPTLLYRSDVPMQSVFPLDSYGNLLLQTDTELRVINPGYFTEQSLFFADNITSVSLETKTRKIYFLGSVAGIRGVYSLQY